jgi:hypothetical protein
MAWNNETSDDIANELAGYQGDFDAAQAPEGGAVGGKIPDGDYQATIRKVELIRSKKNGKLNLRWRLRVIGPRCPGAELTKWNGFDSAEKLGYLKKDLAICGLQVPALAKLEAILPDLDGKTVEVHVETNGQYQNVYLNSCAAGAPPDVPF